MKIEEFIKNICDDYTIQHINEINGVIVAPLNDEYDLVKQVEVKA